MECGGVFANCANVVHRSSPAIKFQRSTRRRFFCRLREAVPVWQFGVWGLKLEIPTDLQIVAPGQTHGSIQPLSALVRFRAQPGRRRGPANLEHDARSETWARSIAEHQRGRRAGQLTCKAASAGGSVVRVVPRHMSTDCHACRDRPSVPLGARELACGGCGRATDRDVNAARNILQRGIALARWDAGPSGRPGASTGVPERHVAGLPGAGRGNGVRQTDGWPRT
ncbi:MAG: transposase [Boseongicola sp. SB0665_bin_10]|nr:transposase [Boseongicola sp. SB0665_bin_10]